MSALARPVRHIILTDEAKRFFTQRATGKTGKDLLLPRPDGEAWGKSEQQQPMQEACAAGKIAPAIGFHILRHTHASRLAMAACRWASSVRSSATARRSVRSIMPISARAS